MTEQTALLEGPKRPHLGKQEVQKNGSLVLWRGDPAVKKRERGVDRETHKENTALKPLAGETSGADFHEFLQTVELKVWSSQVSRLGRDRALKVLPYSWRTGRQTTPGQTVCAEDHIRHMRETLFALFLGGVYVQNTIFIEIPLWEQKASGCHFPPLPLIIGIETPAESG